MTLRSRDKKLKIGFSIWCSVLNFIKIGRFFTEIWRYNDFQNGDRPLSWILKICSFLSCGLCRHAVLLPHTKFRRNRTISRWVMAKKKRFLSWQSPPSWIPKISIFSYMTAIGFNICCSVPSFIEIGQFLTEIFNDFQNSDRPPSWILRICIFCHVALVSMPFCFLVQNFDEIRQSVDGWVMAKKAIFKMAAAAILNFKNFNL